jgi:hypothetical protein
MRYERYFQYTKGWHQINVGSDFNAAGILEWCENHDSPHAYHTIVDQAIPGSRYYSARKLSCRIRFESQEDSVLFALTWVGER